MVTVFLEAEGKHDEDNAYFGKATDKGTALLRQQAYVNHQAAKRQEVQYRRQFGFYCQYRSQVYATPDQGQVAEVLH